MLIGESEKLICVKIGTRIIKLLELHTFDQVKRYGIRRAFETRSFVNLYMTVHGIKNMEHDLSDRIHRTNWKNNIKLYEQALTRVESAINKYERYNK